MADHRLFGPVLFYDLMRTARRGRYLVLRCVYAAALLLTLVATWPWSSVPLKMMPRYAESFFASFMIVQFAAVFLLTPAYTAGAIADEKERRTLDFLLATDLRDREIVLGKLAARLANMLLLLLTGLPVLSLLQFLGGVDPNLVLAGFVAIVFTVLGLGSLSILVSAMRAGRSTPSSARISTRRSTWR